MKYFEWSKWFEHRPVPMGSSGNHYCDQSVPYCGLSGQCRAVTRGGRPKAAHTSPCKDLGILDKEINRGAFNNQVIVSKVKRSLTQKGRTKQNYQFIAAVEATIYQ